MKREEILSRLGYQVPENKKVYRNIAARGAEGKASQRFYEGGRHEHGAEL